MTKLFLVLLLMFGRNYHTKTVQELSSSPRSCSYWPYVKVDGWARLPKKEADNDNHFKLVDETMYIPGHFIVVECIPELPCKLPRDGQLMKIKGVTRWDYNHNWCEIHPRLP